MYIVYVHVDNAMYTKIVTFIVTFILVQIFEWQLKISDEVLWQIMSFESLSSGLKWIIL